MTVVGDINRGGEYDSVQQDDDTADRRPNWDVPLMLVIALVFGFVLGYLAGAA